MTHVSCLTIKTLRDTILGQKEHVRSNMSHVKIKGKHEALQITADQAQNVLDMYVDYKEGKMPDQVLQIGSWTGMLSSVHSVEVEKKNNKKDYARERAEQEAREREAELSKPIEVRAKQVGFFSLIYWGFTGGDPSQETIDKAIEIQRKFFTENPKRLFCDTELYKPLLSGRDSCDATVIRIAAAHVSTDKHYAK